MFPNHHPAIIDDGTWNQANQKDITANKTKITAWNEFRDLAKCGVCGSNMTIVRNH